MSKQQSLIFDYPMMIREHHIDTLGHVNNATYLEIFEEARWDLITNNGYGMREMFKTQIGPVILEINMKFLKELKNREKVVIKSQCNEYEGKIGKLTQWIVNEKGEEACRMVMTFGLFDLKARKLIDPTPEWMKAIGIGG